MSEHERETLEDGGMAVQAASDESCGGAEAVHGLLRRMAARRKVLLGIVDYCREPRSILDVEGRVRELQSNNASVYSAASLCTMLEEAGALLREAEGVAIDPANPFEPDVEVVDGVEYLRPHRLPAVMWRSTDAGLEALEEDDPLERFRELIEEERIYMPIYLKVFELCDRDGGASTKELGDAVDRDELVQSPRLFAQHFVERLERCDAVEWTDAWRTTQLGRTAHEELALIEADR